MRRIFRQVKKSSPSGAKHSADVGSSATNPPSSSNAPRQGDYGSEDHSKFPSAERDGNVDKRQALNQILSRLKLERIDTRRVRIHEESEFVRGGFGDVHPATLDGHIEQVAVKEIRVIGNEQQRLRVEKAFARELVVWSNLSHKNVLSLIGYHHNPEQGVLWFISPFMTEGNVKRYLRRTSPKMNVRIQLTLDAAEGLAYLHKEEVCHGDMKEANVLIKEGQDRPIAVLCDFGLSRIRDATPPGLTTVGLEQKGSPRYFSPELLCAEPVRTFQSDIWAWGCVALEITSDRIPHERIKDEYFLLVQVKLGSLPANLDDLPLNDEVKDILNRCWMADPQNRPSMQENCARLSRSLERGFLEQAIRSALPQSVVDLNESPLEESSAFELAPEVPQAKNRRSSFMLYGANEPRRGQMMAVRRFPGSPSETPRVGNRPVDFLRNHNRSASV